MKNNLYRTGIIMVVLFIATIAFIMFGKSHQAASSAHLAKGVRTLATRYAERSESDPERDERRKGAITLAAQKWYEELLEKYPGMKPVYRDVPDEDNGYLQFILLADHIKKPVLPMDWVNMAFQGDSDWDAAKFKEWVTANQRYVDEILRVAELPDRSTKGIALDRFLNGNFSRLNSEFAVILRASARLAFESGDHETALRYIQATGNFGDHFADIEVPSMLGEVVSLGIRSRSRDLFFESFLPTLANDPEALKKWRDAIFRTEKPASEYARTITGEWHVSTRSLLLPALLGDRSVLGTVLPVDDAAGVIDSYTLAMQASAEGVSRMGADRFDVAQAAKAFPPTNEIVNHTDDSPRKITAEGILSSIGAMAPAFGMHATRNAMESAAIAILIGEAPPVDPVSGKAFVWNEETRTLSSPTVEDDLSIILPLRN